MRIPQELINVDILNYDVQMAYDLVQRGAHIFITPHDLNENGRHWWFDWDTRGLFPIEYPTLLSPTRAYAYDADDPTVSAVMVGGRNGYLFKHVVGAGTDDGEEFESYALLGPFRAATDESIIGIVEHICSVLAGESGIVDWSLYVGDNDEDAADLVFAAGSGSWDRSGLNFKNYPRRRGASFVVKIENNNNGPWGIERVTVGLRSAGVLRPNY